MSQGLLGNLCRECSVVGHSLDCQIISSIAPKEHNVRCLRHTALRQVLRRGLDFIGRRPHLARALAHEQQQLGVYGS